MIESFLNEINNNKNIQIKTLIATKQTKERRVENKNRTCIIGSVSFKFLWGNMSKKERVNELNSSS